MKVKIQHLNFYNYTEPVFLESQEIRLCPKNNEYVKIRDFRYIIEPEPFSSRIITDSEENSVIKAWFNQKTDFLNIDISWEGENTDFNPYNFIIHTDSADLPAEYSSVNKEALNIYRKIDRKNNSVKKFSDSIAQKTKNKTLDFLSELSGEIYDTFLYEKREEGESYTPEFTLKERKGACRDLAVLFLACCRYQGLAARFVSGYKIDKESSDLTDLHAWSEVFIEGAGWKGFDPSLGLAVDDEYFAIAASYFPSATLPVIGNYRSNSATSKLRTCITSEIL